jgi:hypothetical protein
MHAEKRKRPDIIHTVRTRDGGTITARMTKGLAIKMMCTECMGYEANPSECTSTFCPLFPYRKKTLRTMKGE